MSQTDCGAESREVPARSSSVPVGRRRCQKGSHSKRACRSAATQHNMARLLVSESGGSPDPDSCVPERIREGSRQSRSCTHGERLKAHRGRSSLLLLVAVAMMLDTFGVHVLARRFWCDLFSNVILSFVGKHPQSSVLCGKHTVSSVENTNCIGG